MKKILAMLLTLCLVTGTGCALAEDTLSALEQIVRSALDSAFIDYTYDEENQWFDMSFPLDCSLESTDVTIFLFDDMVTVSALAPLVMDDDAFEKAAVFTSLVNPGLFYGAFLLDREYGVITCDSSNVVESVLPSEDEIRTLLYMPVLFMDTYGDGLAAVCNEGADPYEAYEACEDARTAE